MSAAILEAPELASVKSPSLSGKQRLEKALTGYREAAEELASYRASAAKAGVEEDKALNDTKLSEEQAAERITRAQNLQGVYKSRIANREAKLTEMEKSLEAVTTEAIRELGELTHTELQRRNELLIDRVCAVLGVTAKDVIPGQIHRLLGLSPHVQSILACQPQGNAFVNVGSPADRAADLLGKFDRFLAEQGKEI